MRKFLFLLIVLVVPVESFSACTPETIQFYLDKGFNQEQITKLCGQNETAQPAYKPYQKPIVIYQEGGARAGISAEERRAVNEIKGAVDARSVDVTDKSIDYIRKLCLVGGNSKEVDQRVKKCIDVAYSVSREGLKVIESGKGNLVIGQVELKIISSNIKRKTVIANPWDSFSPDIRFSLKRKYEATQTGNVTTLPVRKSASVGQVVNALKTISAATDLENTEYESEVAKVLDEKYIPPTEEEYLASQPTYDEVQEQEKKKKKWWNPFD